MYEYLICLFLWFGKEMTTVCSAKLIFRETQLLYIVFNNHKLDTCCIAYKNEHIIDDNSRSALSQIQIHYRVSQKK